MHIYLCIFNIYNKNINKLSHESKCKLKIIILNMYQIYLFFNLYNF